MFAMAMRALLVFPILFVFCSAVEVQNLGGQWLLKDEDGSKYQNFHYYHFNYLMNIFLSKSGELASTN